MKLYDRQTRSVPVEIGDTVTFHPQGKVIRVGRVDSMRCPMVYIKWNGDRHVSAHHASEVGMTFHIQARPARNGKKARKEKWV